MIIEKLGLHHPFFRPLIRRVLTVLVIAIWGLLEAYQENHGWALFALFLLTVCSIAFFIRVDPTINGDKDG